MINITEQNEKLFSRIIIGASVAIPVVVALLMFVLKPNPDLVDVSFLPPFHAFLNSLATLLLVIALFAIKAKNIARHRLFTQSALLTSVVFLVSYVVYHSLAPTTSYPIDAPYRSLYLVILLTHIVLAAVIVPLVLFTFMRAYKGNFEKHRKIAKVTMPLWLYVTVTGVVVYFMIAPYY